ncbi:WRDR85 family WD repeat protein [Schizosaccharomyces cryophilus OY26]|uniref:methylated diphthine methylhydrolase n=1 Tax=Schizosaccharomyces cryophilus (strain OY26 / ATCC MYA-4695 / CBS 11777 / NBRC 106824 / NRRL Y48691) TaxID=653667 RepID=S9VY96_SCHCR|nr:WRDR85 family WD repeat protein [Schizosaccharomyces cryophilus OY26]EPY51224.1 WRDR85 family WD repeat protein [Schizosaccharomyces cryophilus OY26]
MADQGIKGIATDYTDWPADVCKYSVVFDDILVVGTYMLDEATRLRHGKLVLYDTREKQLNRVFVMHCDAILDFKWSPLDPSILAVAHSTGHISFYRHQFRAELMFLRGIKVADSSVLMLALDFSDDGRDLSISLSNGAVLTIDISSGAIKNKWKEHQYEAWTVHYSRDDNNMLYSGGDDAVLNCYDQRIPSSCVWKDIKTHQSGVVSVLSRPPFGPYIATGEYGDSMHTLDTRRIGRPLTNANLGGGVWRLEHMYSNDDYHQVLGVLMHRGAQILRIATDFSSIDASSGIFGDHQSMCYGGDWRRRDNLVATCSFYDKRVCLWEDVNHPSV